MMITQWVFAPVVAAISVYFSMWVLLAVLVISCALGIPAERKFLRLLREHAYRHGSPSE